MGFDGAMGAEQFVSARGTVCQGIGRAVLKVIWTMQRESPLSPHPALRAGAGIEFTGAMRTAWWIWWSFPVMAAGCIALAPPNDQPIDEGQKNLEAIREILSSYPCRACNRSPQRSEPTQEPHVGSPGSGAALSSSPSADQYPADRPPRLFMGFGDRSMPRRSSASDPRVTIPWKPTKPSPIVPDEPFRPVPPYFHPAPVAPTYPGTVRCVPDFAGGQRCLPN